MDAKTVLAGLHATRNADQAKRLDLLLKRAS